jgi:PAS domain S-box-containing protein
MDIGSLSLISDPVQRNRLLVIVAATVLTFILNLVGMIYGITEVLPHLFYIPIILAGYWYPRKGIVFSLAIAILYGLLAFSFPISGPSSMIPIGSRMGILVIIGAVVSFLSSRLSESEHQLHDIIDFLPDASFAIDREGRVIAWNRAIEEMTGKKKAEILFRDNYEYALPFYGERRPMLAGLLVRNEVHPEERYPSIKKAGGNLVSEVYLAHFNGGRGAYLRFSARALVDADGNVKGAIESIRDVTDRVMTEAALRKTGNRLNTLAGIIRHDMSAKLAILYGHLRLGAMKFTDPEVKSFIASIQESADSINRQIETSREFREIGTMPPAWIPVQGAVGEAAARLDPGTIAFRAWTERLEVFSDPHLPTVFYHIFHNSLKETTGARKIIVTYQLKDNGCAIIVEDDGTGIPDAEKEQLFVQRGDRFGRGLFLSHEILSITGIAIRETGRHGLGARFEIFVPSEGYRIEGVGA